MSSDGRRALRLRRVPAGPAFAAAFKHGKRSKDRYFLVYANKNPLVYSRLGVNVGRKVSLRAVERNRIKRLVREGFRQIQQEIASVDVVVVAQAAAGGAERSVLLQSIDSHLKKIAGLCRKS